MNFGIKAWFLIRFFSTPPKWMLADPANLAVLGRAEWNHA